MASCNYPRRETLLLLLVAYLTWGGVALLGLSLLRQVGGPWKLAAGLMLLFGLLMALVPRLQSDSWRLHPYLALQATLVTALIPLHAAPLSTFAILNFVLSAQAMLMLPLGRGLSWIGLLTLLTGGAFVYRLGWPGGLLTLLPYAGGYLFFGTFAHVLARAEAARRRSQALLAELQEAHRQLQAYATQVEALAVAQERNRLAREMHDTLGHRLTVAAVQLEGAQWLIPTDPERASRMVETVRRQVREALAELRQTVAALQAPLEADLALDRALTRLATGFEEATGIAVHLTLPNEMPALPAAHRLALYRAAQEALTNVQRHAQAGNVWLQLARRDGEIELLVGDDGIGFPANAEEGGFGLRGLRERATRLGGALRLESRPGGGAQLRLHLPLAFSEESEPP